MRWQKDPQLTVERPLKVESLKALILKLCTRTGESLQPEMPHHEKTFIRLQNELVNGVDALFVFVAHPEVEAPDNRSECNVHREAEVRKGGRTSKSESGTKRRGIIMTVLAPLNTRFERFRNRDEERLMRETQEVLTPLFWRGWGRLRSRRR